MTSEAQTLRLRKPKSAREDSTPKPKTYSRHSGILQDQLKRSAKAPWAPSFSVAFRILFLLRFSAAIYSNIQDCDEVYNFWEPLHYLHHGVGFQTWELSPEFAIRSWSYVLLHLGLLKPISGILSLDKRSQFFALRCLFALVTTLCEVKLYRSVVEHAQIRVGRYMFFIMLFSAGMWGASTAFLPSTFAMYTTTLATAYAFQLPSVTRYWRTLAATVLYALGALIGWPFALAVAIPFVFEEIFLLGADRVVPQNRVAWAGKRFLRFIECGMISSLILIPSILVDSFYYGKLTIAPWNIIKYNMFGGVGRGPDLYGTSPWHFYFQNLALNFNIAAPAALFSLPALYITYCFDRERLGVKAQPNETSPFKSLAIRLAPLYVWVGILSAQPHKEERFLYPVYPLICFNAGTTLYLTRGWIEVIYVRATKSPYRAARSPIFSLFTLTVILTSSFLSVSRILAVTRYYNAPLHVASHFEASELPRLLNVTGLLSNYPLTDESPRIDLNPVRVFNLTLCIGKEWYRFPSHYMVPSGINVEFIKSGFDGLLPRHFLNTEGSSFLDRVEGTRFIPTDLNDLNREERSHLVDVSTCDYLIDLDYPDRQPSPEGPHEGAFASDEKTWERVICKPFLDASNTPILVRILWLPGARWRERASWGNYCIIRNKELATKRESRIWIGE